VLSPGCLGPAQAKEIQHDAEYYILQAQNGERWAVEDKSIDSMYDGAMKNDVCGAPPRSTSFVAPKIWPCSTTVFIALASTLPLGCRTCHRPGSRCRY
jgi:hypothetical protein